MREEQDRDWNDELRGDRDDFLESNDFIDYRPTRQEIEMEEAPVDTRSRYRRP